jgi:hypothetical protein
MREMLDQEMPVDGKSRKPIVFWWYWMAAAAVLVGAIGLFWLLPPEKPELGAMLVPLAGEQQLTAGNEVPDTPAELAPAATEPALARMEETPLSPSENHRPSERQDREMTAMSGVDTQESGPLAEEDLASAPEAATDIPDDLTTLSKEVISSVEAAETLSENPVLTNPQSPGPQLRAAFTLDQLPKPLIAALDQKPLPLSRINGYNPKKPLLVPLEINAGLIAGLNSGAIQGGMTELRSGIYLHNAARWSFQTGIGLHLQREPFRISFKTSGSEVEADAAESPGPGNPTTSDPGQITDFYSLSKAVATSDIDLQTLYLDVPLLFDWQFSRHWSVSAGGRMSWLLSTVWKASRNDESLNFSGGAGFDLALSNSSRQYAIYPLGSNNVPTTLVLSDFYASGTLGLTYRPNTRWNLRLQYQHSLTNQLDNSVYQKTDRSLWLSAGLRF